MTPATGDVAPLRILFMSHTAPNPHLVVGSHHLSRELSLAGHEVAHIAGPVSLLHLARANDRGVRERLRASLHQPRRDWSRVVQAVPLTLTPLNYASHRVRRAELSVPGLWRSGLLNQFHDADIAFVDQPFLGELATSLESHRRIYRPTDAHYDTRTRKAELECIGSSDAVVATSSTVLQEVLDGTDWRGPTTVLENGVDHKHFMPTKSQARAGFVYVGAVDRRFDWQVIHSLAIAFPREVIEIVGPLKSNPGILPSNVTLTGPLPYSDIPQKLHKARIGLLPLSSAPGNEGRSPMKYYEYLAAGLCILGRSSPALAGRTTPGVRLYSTIDEAIHMAGDLMSLPSPSNDDGIEAAREYGWDRRAQALLEFAQVLN